jgi:hypothetical protein
VKESKDDHILDGLLAMENAAKEKKKVAEKGHHQVAPV